MAQDKKPSVVYILGDDLGWKDVGFHGSDIKTPHLDKLAATGVRLEQFYAQPMCTPTRAALLTGRYPFRYGLHTAVIPSAHTYGLPTNEWLLPQTLKEAGHQTAISERKPSPRAEIVYNVEPFRAGIREGDWKLIWRTPLPSALELYNVAQDPSEKNNVAAQNPAKVAELQKRANELAATMAKPMLLEAEFEAIMQRLHMPPALPGQEFEFNEEN